MTKNEKIIKEMNEISEKFAVLNKEILELCKKIDTTEKIEEKEASRIVVTEMIKTRKILIANYDSLKNEILNGRNK